jgi:ABC-type lipoprotein release transport system permease subunit
MATRNVWRHRHRSMVTIFAMGFAGGIMILYAALMEGMLADSERNAISMNSGEIQIHAHGYRKDPDLYKRIENDQQILADLENKGIPASPRLYGFGLVAAGTASAGIQLRGIDIERESKVTQIHKHLIEGSWLTRDKPNQVVIGRRLAHTLGVNIGDEVVIVSQAADGSMANALFYIRGILKSVGEAIDRGGFFMVDDAFRELMVVPHHSHEIVIMHPDEALPMEQKVADVVAVAGDYEIKNWRELMPVIANLLDSADASIIVMILITYVAVAMVVLNAMLMSVFERIREFGVMKALGFSPWKLVSLIFIETQIQVLLATLLMLAIGVPSALYFQTNGIDLSSMSSGISFGGIAMDTIWRAYVSPNSIILPVSLLIIIATLAIIYPAIKAAVIHPVEAINHR